MYPYKLLIEKYQKNLEKILKSEKAVIIKGPTGCGKSTFVPILLKNYNVAIIEPRRIAVTSLYNILKTQIPNIGYKMRFNKILPKNDENKTMIFTDGTFLAEMDLEYDYIIIDEVHERSLRTDILLSVLKRKFNKKIILMSATLNTEKIQNYFQAKVFEIPGSSHPLEIKYLERPTSDYIVESYLTVKNIIKDKTEDDRKDILIFLPGAEDINELYKLILKIPSVLAFKIYSAMSDSEQNKIYEPSNMQKVILSTNICETSLTIPNIKYVIDTGLYKNKIFNGINYLGIQPINKDSAIQRMGRCNRLGPGICYKLYIKNQILPDYMPEILRSDLKTVLLQLINLKINIFETNFIDSPPLNNIVSGVDFLLEKNLIEIYQNNLKVNINNLSNIQNLEFKITKLGKRLAGHPFDVDLANFYENMIEAKLGFYGSCILSLISMENYNFLSGKPSPDIIELIHLMEGYKESNDKYKYCLEKNIPFKGMEKAYKIFKTLNKSKSIENLEIVEKIFSNCFSHNLCIRQADGSYKMERNEQIIYIHPSSGFFKKNVKKIVVVDIFYTTKMYARIVGQYYKN